MDDGLVWYFCHGLFLNWLLKWNQTVPMPKLWNLVDPKYILIVQRPNILDEWPIFYIYARYISAKIVTVCLKQGIAYRKHCNRLFCYRIVHGKLNKKCIRQLKDDTWVHPGLTPYTTNQTEAQQYRVPISCNILFMHINHSMIFLYQIIMLFPYTQYMTLIYTVCPSTIVNFSMCEWQPAR